jgi:hypothetical protein
MATDHIIALLISERDKVTGAIEALQGPTKPPEKTPGPGRNAVLPSVERDSKPAASVGPTAPVNRKLSAAGRRAIIAATKKRWATIKAAKAADSATAAMAAPKATRAKAPGAAKPKAASAKDAAFRKRMSERMKAAWAARKKRAAAKGK